MRIDVERLGHDDYLAPGWDVTVRLDGTLEATTYAVTEEALREAKAPVSPVGAVAMAMFRRQRDAVGLGVTLTWGDAT